MPQRKPLVCNSRVRENTIHDSTLSIHARKGNSLYTLKPTTCSSLYGASSIQKPAAACKKAKTMRTVFCGKKLRIFAPKIPPKSVPNAVGKSTFTSNKPPIKYHKNDSKETGKTTAIAVACASFSSFPKRRKAGTASIPPPPPKIAFAAPIPAPKNQLLHAPVFTILSRNFHTPFTKKHLFSILTKIFCVIFRFFTTFSSFLA